MRRSLIGLLLVHIIWLLLMPRASVAQQNTFPPGVDIVFVVDQSGSMSKGSIRDNNNTFCTPVVTAQCPRTPASDPNNLALKTLPDGLSPLFEQILERALGRDAVEFTAEQHRFGLILFGGSDTPQASAQVKVPLTLIDVRKDGEGNVISNIEQDNLLPTQAVNLGDTAFSAAFDAACSQLSCDNPPPPGRKRVVVLLTDGQPARDTIGFSKDAPGPYFAALKQQHANLLNTARLEVIGLDAQGQFWPTVGSYWEALAAETQGHARLVTDPKQIGPLFNDIATEVVGEPPAPLKSCNTNFKVEPYKASLRLLLQYPDTESRAVFKLPDGQILTKDTPGVERIRSAQTESFIIANPIAGIWSCEITGGGVDTKFRDIEGEFKLTEVKVDRPAGASGSTCDSFGFMVSYRDKTGDVISELPEYPLQQTATITVGQDVISRPLVPDNAEHSRWKLDGLVKPTIEGGDYPVSIDVRLIDNTPVFSSPQQKVTIDPKLPCLRIVEPQEGAESKTYNKLAPTDVDVIVELMQGGKPGTPVGIFREDLSTIITAQLTGPGYSRDLKLVPSETPGRFTAKVPGLQAIGSYQLTAELKATTQNGEPYVLAPTSISFKRVPDPWREIFLLLMRILAGIIMLLIGTLIGWFVYLITGPYPRGSLVLEQRNTGPSADIKEWEQIKSIPLSSIRLFGLFRTRRPTIKKGLPKVLGLRKLKVRRLVSGRTEGVTVTGIRTDKKPPLTLQFARDQQHKPIDANYRIKYQNYSKNP